MSFGDSKMYDLVIRGGRLIDGSGAPERPGDIAVLDGRIAAVGHDLGRARREVDAEGLLVTPGFVDIHTHYDGQATWDSYLTPSSWHGVTSAVFGNCSVGFAPVKPDQTDYLINLMEGVEDIPGTVLVEGVSFDWETFPEYLDALEQRDRVMDIGAQVPHAALRFYVMGNVAPTTRSDRTRPKSNGWASFSRKRSTRVRSGSRRRVPRSIAPPTGA